MVQIQIKLKGIKWLILFAVYLSILAYFALRPFHRIPGLSSGRPSMGYEDVEGGKDLYKALMKNDQISLAAGIRPADAELTGPARIISFSRNEMTRNFTLGQEGRSLLFRLRTTQTSDNGIFSSVYVTNVFKADELTHIIITYDGQFVDTYIKGLHVDRLPLSGSFEVWGRDHLLVIGDEPVGGRAWYGNVDFLAVYDKALKEEDVEALYTGASVQHEPVYTFDKKAARPLRYRNLFIVHDPVFNMCDGVLNIIAFFPLAFLLYALQLYFLSEPLQRGTMFAIVFGVGLILSALFEFTQRILIGRVPCLMDILYNGFGTLVGYVLLRLGLAHSGFKQTKE